MTLLEARLHGRLAETIFSPPSIHPDLRAMLNPENLRRMGPDGKRKRSDEGPGTSPKKARIAAPTALEEEGFGDGGLGDTGFGDGGFGDTGFGDGGFGDRPDSPLPNTRPRTISPSLIEEDPPVEEDEEQPTSVTGNISHSTVAAAQLLQKELGNNNTMSTLHDLTLKAVPQGVKREDAVKMFFEVLVLASRDVIRVRQNRGFGEIRVQGKDGLFKAGGFAGQQQSSSQQIFV
jgi:cohesin complex subunit SCC1